jgi:hypothetical protein
MMVTMPGYAHPPKGGRVRTPVGHRYLEVLQLQAATDTDGGSTTSTNTPRDEEEEEEEEGLNLLILGMTSGTAMDDIDFALCRFTQVDPEAPLHLDIIQVCMDCAFKKMIC